MTWQVFDEKANRFANLLLSRGIRKDDKVTDPALQLHRVAPIFGVLKSGATVVPLNFRFSADGSLLRRESPTPTSWSLAPSSPAASRSCPRWKGRLLFYVGDIVPPGPSPTRSSLACLLSRPHDPLSEDEDAAVAARAPQASPGHPAPPPEPHPGSHHGAEAPRPDARRRLSLHPAALPHQRHHALDGVARRGRARRTPARREPQDHILETVSNRRCTIVWLLVPWKHRTSFSPSSSRWPTITSTSGASCTLAPSPAQEDCAAGSRSSPTSSTTPTTASPESCGPGCIHLGVENVDHVSAIGVPGYQWECKIVDEKGESHTRRGWRALREARASWVLLQGPAATAEMLIDGWLHTGDMARQDETTSTWLVDRKKDVIVMGGENLYPVVEGFRLQPRHPGRGRHWPARRAPGRDTHGNHRAQARLRGHHRGRHQRVLPWRSPATSGRAKGDALRGAEKPHGQDGKPLLRERYGAAHLVDQENKA